MRTATLSLAFLASVAFSVSAFAQEPNVKTGGEGREGTVKVSLNGGWDVGAVYWDGDLLQASGRTVGGGTLSDNADALVNGNIHLDFRATIEGDVDVHIRLQNNRYDGGEVFGGGGVRMNVPMEPLGQSNGDVGIDWRIARVAVHEVFAQGLTIAFGVMDVRFDLRGRGNSIFLDAAGAESPWFEIGNGWFNPTKNELRPVGAKLTYGEEGLDLEIGFFQMEDASSRGVRPDSSGQERFFYAHLTYDASDKLKVAGIFGFMDGTNPGENVTTWGAAAVLRPSDTVELFAEGYVQTGDAAVRNRSTVGETVTPSGDVQARGTAIQLGGRIELGGGAWIELAALQIDGLENSTPGTGAMPAAAEETDEFMSYENNDDMLILDSNEWGLDIDNNIEQIKGKIGLRICEGWEFVGKAATARAREDYEFAPGDTEDSYGVEIDLSVVRSFSKQVKVYLTVATLISSDILKRFTSGSEEDMFVILLGSEAGF